MAILGRGIPIPVTYLRAVNVWPFVDPASVPNLFCWFDASVGSSFTPTDATGNITAWNDLSGNARHLDQISNTPSRDGTLNGLPTVVVAPNEAVYRTQTAALSAAASTIFAVAKVSNSGSGIILAEALSTATTQNYLPISILVTTGFWRYNIRGNGAGTTPDQFDDDAVDCATDAFLLLKLTDTGTSVSRWVDGVSTGAAYTRTNVHPDTNRFALGALMRSTPVFGTGTVEYAEVVAYARVLEPAEIAAVEDYLTDKWLTGATPLLVADATHSHTAANVALTQHQVLTVADATHSHTVANVALTQHQVLTVASATHAHTAGATVLVQHQVLTVAASTHAHSAGATVLTQHQVLAVAAATHAHTAEPVALTQHQVLVVADSTHAHSAGNVTLGVGVVTLVVADTVHAHTVEAVTLIQHQVLTVANATHGHTAAAVTLTQHHVLTVAAATHGHSADNVTLGVAGVLGVQDATHAHTAAAVVLTQHQVLVVANATHAHTVETVNLSQGFTLVVTNATHSHSVAAVVLTQHHVLVVASATHAHSAAPVALTQHHTLAVDNALHAHLAAVVVFNVLVLVGPLTTGTIRRPRTTLLEGHARTTSLERHPRTTEAP